MTSTTSETKETQELLNAGKTIGVIGAGVMGRALITGMLETGLISKRALWAAVGTRTSRDRLAAALDIPVSSGAFPARRVAQTDIFLICTKPYRVANVLEALLKSGPLKPQALVLSVAAGVKLKKMEARLPGQPVIRAMPNTPCLIGAGATVCAAGSKATAEHMALANRIFSSVGQCYELDEQHMDAVTAVCGSGPAYGYLIMEALADGAVKVGLPRNLALQLVAQAMLGSALMLQRTGKHPATLKDEVTTPAGCTISGLLVMEDGRIRSILARAVEEATRVAGELG